MKSKIFNQKTAKMLFRIMICVGIIAVITWICVYLYNEYQYSEFRQKRIEYVENSDYSDTYVVVEKGGNVRTRSVETGKYLTPKLSQIILNMSIKDTLTVFFQDNKRGFLNVYTGEISIPATFDKAWIFSEGLGGVVKDGKLGFINKRGEIVIPCQFPYSNLWKNEIDYVFKNGTCAVFGENGKCGIINKQGKWVLEPQFDYINNPVKEMRIVKQNELYGLLNSDLQLFSPPIYESINLNNEGISIAKDGVQQLISYDGKTILEPFVIDKIYQLWIATGEYEDGSYKNELIDYAQYRSGWKYGLFDLKNNKIITKAIYGDIEAITNNLFKCSFSDNYSSDAVLINGKGEVVK